MKSSLKEHLVKALEQGIRFDERKLEEFRPVTIEYSISKSAEGSARVKIGNTEVLAGVKMEIGEPYPDTPDEGTIIVNAELLPLSNPEFESGPPGIEAVELARIVDRTIRESKTLDFKKLVVKEGKIWMLLIDVMSVNDEGNLIDAAALAALAAIKDAQFPKIEDDKIDYKHKTKDKPMMRKVPIAVTVHKIGNAFIVDPTSEEEKASDARLTVATLKEGTLCALQKGGDAPLSADDINKMVEIAIEKGKELRKLC